MYKKYIFVLILTLLIASCNKSENPVDNNNPPPTTGGTFTVEIDGGNWTANTNAVFASTTTVNNVTSILITAAQNINTASADGFGISLTKTNSSGSNLTGQYQLGGTVPATITFVRTISNTSESFAAISGQVNITEVSSTHMKGTFNAVLQDLTNPANQLTLSNGSFNALIALDQ
ncbi:MAG: hypothetical protein HND52_13070 [Ignavibacteriae bacterium]|jgi:PBP1b-binding outer membrane lipoprotein LpoB|nr:hypothetical protein [Ignavibacteriota bacterium]NOG98883.1 hypothetical protein [Ignavibacteriota bacterium]